MKRLNEFFLTQKENIAMQWESFGFWGLGFEFEFAHDRKCDLDVWVGGWLIVLASVIVFLVRFFCSFLQFFLSFYIVVQ